MGVFTLKNTYRQYVQPLILKIKYLCKKIEMEGTRLQKVARLIQKDLGEILQREGQSMFAGKMITVTQVRVSPDLALAKVYLSIFPSAGGEQTLEGIKNHARYFRGELGKRVRYQMRVVPELAFFIDDSLDYIENIDRLLNK